MARPRRTATHTFSPSQAVFILERAIADRKLSAADLKTYAAGMMDEIRSLEARLAALKDSAVESVKHVAHAVVKPMDGGMPFPPKKTRKRKKPVSAKTAATRIVQGQYLSFLNQTPKTKRAKFQKMAKTGSREAAIAAMKKALGK